MRRRTSLGVATALVAAGALATPVWGLSIDTTAAWNGLNGLNRLGNSPETPPDVTGNPLVHVGQTFIVPATTDPLTSFTLYVDDYEDPDPLQFRGYVMEWSGDRATGPVLYASDTRVTTDDLVDSDDFEAFTFDTGGIFLTPGETYVAFLSISELVDPGPAPFLGSGRLGFLGQNVIDGSTVFQVYDAGSGGDNAFSRVTEEGWSALSGDLAFTATFVPTPVAAGPALAGVMAALLLRRRDA